MSRLFIPGLASGGLSFLGAPLTVLQATLVTKGVWPKLVALYINAVPTAAAGVVNLKSPGTFDLVATNSPTFTPNNGFTGDGVSMHLLGSTFTAMAAAGFSVNNMSAGVFSLNTVKSTTIGLGGTDTASSPFGFQSADNSRSAGMRSSSTTTDLLPAANSGICHIAFSRNSAGSYSAYIDRMKTTIPTASVFLPSAAKLTYLRAATAFTQGEIAAGWIGSALTDADYAALDSAIVLYLQQVQAYTQKRGLDGAWTWFNDPRVINVAGSPVIGAITSNGTTIVAKDNVSTGLTERALLHNILLTDDHCNPGIIRSSVTGKIVTGYNKHNDAAMFSRISTNADDITSFATEVNLASQLGINGASNYAYANFVELSGEANKLYLFFRATTALIWTLHYATSGDGGATWGGANRLLWNGRPYWKTRAVNGNRIDIVCNDQNPGDSTYTYCNTYHFYYQGGKFYTSAGVDMGAPPFTQLQPTKIYDSQASGHDSWVWDIVHDAHGKPVTTFAVFPTTSDHRYHQARWDGSAWMDNEVCAAGGHIYAGQLQYSGGVVNDPTDINTVYCSRMVDSSGNVVASGGVFQLFKFVTGNNGSSWTGTQLTFGTEFCIRPYIAEGIRKLFYTSGTYNTYTDYQTVIKSIDI